MSKLTVEDTSLVAVADAIRSKSKTTEPMVFPEGFVSAVEGISDNVLPSVVDGSATEITAEMLAGCTKIRAYAFYSMSFTNIEIPESVTYIGSSAFNGCSSLATVELKPTTPPTLSSSSFNNCPALTKIIVPAGTLSAYQSATNWSSRADKMVEASA